MNIQMRRAGNLPTADEQSQILQKMQAILARSDIIRDNQCDIGTIDQAQIFPDTEFADQNALHVSFDEDDHQTEMSSALISLEAMRAFAHLDLDLVVETADKTMTYARAALDMTQIKDERNYISLYSVAHSMMRNAQPKKSQPKNA